MKYQVARDKVSQFLIHYQLYNNAFSLSSTNLLLVRL